MLTQSWHEVMGNVNKNVNREGFTKTKCFKKSTSWLLQQPAFSHEVWAAIDNASS